MKAARSDSDLVGDILVEFLRYHQFAKCEDPVGRKFLKSVPMLTHARISGIQQEYERSKSLEAAFAKVRDCFVDNWDACDDVVKVPDSWMAGVMAVFGSWIVEQDIVDGDVKLEKLLRLLKLMPQERRTLRDFCVQHAVEHYLNYAHKPFPSSLARKAFEKCTPRLFDVIVLVLENALLNRDEEAVDYLIMVLTKGISETPEQYVQCDFRNVMNTIFQLLCKFDAHALDLVWILASVKEDPSLKETISDIARILLSKIETIKPVVKQWPAVHESMIATIDQGVTSMILTDKEQAKQREELVPPAISEFATSLDMTQVISPETLKYADMLVSFVSKVPDSYTYDFFRGFVDIVHAIEGRPCEVEYNLCMLYIMTEARVLNMTQELFDVLSSKKFFTPGISVFNRCDNFELVALIRSKILSIFAQNSLYLSLFLRLYETNAFLFADIIGRIHMDLSSFDLSTVLSEETLAAIIHVVSNLCSLSRQGDEMCMQKAQEARSGLFIFLLAILEDYDIAATCFSSTVFTNGFLSKIFESSLQDAILSLISKFLLRFKGTDVHVLIPLAEFIDSIVRVCSSMTENENPQHVFSSLIGAVNGAVLHNRDIGPIFKSLLYSATTFLTAHPTSGFLEQTLQLYSALLFSSKEVTLSIEHVCQLSKVIEKSEGISPSETTICEIIAMMARSRSVSTSSVFLIHEPLAVVLIFSIVHNAADSVRYLGLFSQLCTSSAYNCMQCHKGELDLLLLNLVRTRSFIFRGCNVDMEITDSDIHNLVIPLVMSIITHACSQQVISKIVELACPAEDQSFPSFSQDLLSSLSSTMTVLAQNPPHLLYLGYDNQTIEVQSFQSREIENGFTFRFSIYLDCHTTLATNKKPAVMRLFDDDMEIELYFQGVSLICTISSPGSKSFAALTHSFPSGVWTNATVVFVTPTDSDAVVTLYINNNLPIIYTVQLPPFKDGLLRVVIGGLAEDIEESDDFVEPICILGSYSMLPEPLDRRKMAELSGMGTRNSGFLQLFSSANQKKSDLFSTVADVLARKNVIANLVPFFLYLPVMPSHYPEMLIGLLQSILSSASFKGDFAYFPLISHMLILCPPEKLSYTTYLKFFGFLGVTSNDATMSSLVRHILFNFELWYPVDGNNLLRIVTHWAQSLFASCPVALGSCFPFHDILCLMRIYFWYEPKELEIIRGLPNSVRPRAANFDVEACRSHLMRLLLAISARPNSFTLRCVRSLMSHSVVCSDSRQVVDLLDLFVKILEAGTVSFAIPEYCTSLLYYHIKPANEARFILAVKALYLICSGNFHESLLVVMSLMNSMFFTDELFAKCLEILVEYPLCYPLGILLAVNIGKAEEMAKALSGLKLDRRTSVMIFSDPLWAIWPIMLLHHLEERYHIFVYGFMLNVLAHRKLLKNLDHVMTMFDLVAGSTGWELERVSLSFFVKVTEHYFGECDTDTQAGLVIRGLRYLLLYINYPGESAIEHAFRESPFCDSCTPGEIPQKKFSSIEDIRKLCETGQGSRFKFGFLLDKNKKPVKQELFALLLNLLKHGQFADDMVSSWQGQLIRFSLEKQDREEARKLNLIAGVYFEFVLRRCLLDVAHVKKIIADSFAKIGETDNQVDATQEISIASAELDMMEQTIVKQTYANERRLRHLFRDTMHCCSPWNGKAPVRSNVRREFMYGEGHSQPLVKHTGTPHSRPHIDKIPNVSQKYIECKLIELGKETPAFLQFEGQGKLVIATANKMKAIHRRDVTRILPRRRFHKETALEIFTVHNQSYFLDFRPKLSAPILDTIWHDDMSSHRHQIQIATSQAFFESMNYTREWVRGRISNFKYLMILNELSGRTFNDMSLYPIFPWVLSDYTSSSFDALTYRVLGLPMTAQPLRLGEVARPNRPFRMAPSHPTLLSYFLGAIEPFCSISSDVTLANQVLSKEPFSNMQDAYHEATINPNCWELPPELYFAPEHFPPGFTFPPWADNSALQFVYLHRKALESDEVSESLNQWIDLTFGVKSRGPEDASVFNTYDPDLYEQSPSDDDIVVECMLRKVGQLPACLFTQPHPRRVPFTRTPTFQTAKVVKLVNKDFMCAQVVASTSSEVGLLAILTDLTVVSCYVNFATPLRKSTTELSQIPKGKIITCGHSSGIVAFNNEKRTMYNVADGKATYEVTSLSDLAFIESSGKRIGMAGADGNIWCWDFPDFRSRFMVTNNSTDYASCIAVSKNFGITAVGTKESQVIVYTSKDSSFRYALNVPAPPKRILITHGWGFLLVESGSSLLLFSVNGTLIKTIALPFEVELITTWKCERGFDFVAVAEPHGDIHVFEAFFMNPDEFTYASKRPVVSMYYNISSRSLSAITRDGRLTMIPIELPF